MKLLNIVLVILSLCFTACAQSDFACEVSASALTQVALPAGTYLVREESVPAEYNQLFEMYINSNPTFSQGRTELLVLTGALTRKPDFAGLRAKIENNLKNDGWNYQVHGTEKDITFFTAVKKSLSPRGNLFGYWVPTNDGLMLAMTEVFVGKNVPIDKSPISNQSQVKNNSYGSQTFNLSADETSVNVMGNEIPALPNFPAVAVKPGKARGYVKDFKGNPLEGARIGVRSTSFGGAYTTSDAETDANGYYEIEIPQGAAYIYTAGYVIDYGAGRAALGLHPADGVTKDFPSTTGIVKNFVLLPYGIADRDKASDAPQDGRNYYGGTLRVGFSVSTLDPEPGQVRAGTEIEITLTPDGEMLDGTAGKFFVIRRKTSDRLINYFFVNNIPVGRYKISAKAGGKTMRLKETGGMVSQTLGLKPKEIVGEASLLFSADADLRAVDPKRGHWRDVNIELTTP